MGWMESFADAPAAAKGDLYHGPAGLGKPILVKPVGDLVFGRFV
jgi:hypothetical protein